MLHLVNLASVRALQDKLGRIRRSAALPAEHRHRRRAGLVRARLAEARSAAGPDELQGRKPDGTLRGHQRRSEDRTARHGDSARARHALRATDFGIYLVATTDGTIAVGDSVLAPTGVKEAVSA